MKKFGIKKLKIKIFEGSTPTQLCGIVNTFLDECKEYAIEIKETHYSTTENKHSVLFILEY